jgi:hypothetical protein
MSSLYTEDELSKLSVKQLQQLIKDKGLKTRRSKLRKAQYIANIIAVTTHEEQKKLEKLDTEVTKIKKKKIVRWHPVA